MPASDPMEILPVSREVRPASRLVYEVVPDPADPFVCIAEAIDYDSEGEVYRVEFSGPHAEARAREYADRMNGPAA